MYEVIEWTPEKSGETVAQVAHAVEAAQCCIGLYQSQITHPDWNGGYIVVWTDMSTSAKYFKQDVLPKDARAIMEYLKPYWLDSTENH